MRSSINKIITSLSGYIHKLKLPKFDGDYFVKPKPSYISQFVGIYPQTIDLDSKMDNKQHITAYGAKDSGEFSFWAWKNCGIACVKMILDAHEKSRGKKMMQLTREGVRLGGYILYEGKNFVDKGWFHHSLVSLLQKYGIFAIMKKWQTIDSIATDILGNKSVILSVLVPGRKHIAEDGSFKPKPNAKYGGHLLLATGVNMKSKQVIGIYVHDPRGLENYQEDTFISADTFKKIFTSRTIVVEQKITSH